MSAHLPRIPLSGSIDFKVTSLEIIYVTKSTYEIVTNSYKLVKLLYANSVGLHCLPMSQLYTDSKKKQYIFYTDVLDNKELCTFINMKNWFFFFFLFSLGSVMLFSGKHESSLQ